jgi:hypothetical protein
VRSIEIAEAMLREKDQMVKAAEIIEAKLRDKDQSSLSEIKRL